MEKSAKIVIALLSVAVIALGTVLAIFLFPGSPLGLSQEKLDNLTPTVSNVFDNGSPMIIYNAGSSTIILVKMNDTAMSPEIVIESLGKQNFTVHPAENRTYTISFTSQRGTVFHLSYVGIVTFSGSLKEALSLENTSFSSSTLATLFIRNTGTLSVSLITYYVKDASGNQYAETTWAGPTGSPNSLLTTQIAIGSSCNSCALSGSAFTFVAGNSYTIVVVTSRNNQFTFTIIR